MRDLYNEKYMKYLRKNLIGGKNELFVITDSQNYEKNKGDLLTFLGKLKEKGESKFYIFMKGRFFLCELIVFVHSGGDTSSFQISIQCPDNSNNEILNLIFGITKSETTVNSFVRTNCNTNLFTNDKLGDVLLMKEIFIKFLGIPKIETIDDAHFSCKNDKDSNYKAIIYRILATDKKYDEISIYNKYGYQYENKNIELFDKIRNYDKNKFCSELHESKKFFNSEIEFIKKLIINAEIDIESKTVNDFFKKLDMNDMCKENSKYFRIIERLLNSMPEKDCNDINNNDDFFTMLKALVNCFTYSIK
jgi:hypothetical protein